MHRLLVLAGLLMPALPAGPPAGPNARVILVELEVTVRDQSGSAIQGLPEDRFRVVELGRPQPITRFEEVPPSRVVLMLDTSPSMEPHFWSARRAAWDLLVALMPGTEVALLGCADAPRLQTGWTLDREEAAAGLEGLLPAKRPESAVIGCVDAAVDLLEVAPAGRGALVLVSDGDDTTLSGEDLQAALARLEVRLVHREVRLDILGYRSPGGMAHVARRSGGTWRSPRRRGSVKELARLLGHHYLVAYYPEDRRSGWRAVTVQVEGEGLDVQAPLGYRLGKAPRRRTVD